jgi:hypothetical protein
MLNFLNTVKTTFSHELVRHLAARLGEGATGTSKALEGLLPMVLGGIINKAKAGEAQLVFDLSQRAYGEAAGGCTSLTGLLGIMGRGAVAEGTLVPGQHLPDLLFGAARGNVVEAVSKYAGVRNESAKTLLGMVGAVLATLLGQHATQRGLTARTMSALLVGLQSQVRAQLPAGLHGLTGIGLEVVGAGRGELNGASNAANPRWYQALMSLVSPVLLVSCLFK